jgi:hypothetical protein
MVLKVCFDASPANIESMLADSEIRGRQLLEGNC